MKGFWSRKLPAFVLALIMTAGVMPAALAADCGHNNWGAWTKLDESKHQRVCLTSGCPGTQEASHSWAAAYETDASSHWKKCTDCGAQTTHEAHNYSGVMKSDSSNHWDQCTVCGYRDNLGGHVDTNNDGKCDTCGYSVGISNTITVTFINGTSTYRTQTITRGGTPANPGTPAKASSGGRKYTFKGWTTTYPGSAGLYTNQSYRSSSQVANTSLSSNTTYYALYTASTSSSSDLTYEVAAGDSLDFDRADFKEIFDDVWDGDDTFRYAVFYADSSLKSSNGVLYHDYGTRYEEELSRSDLEDYEFYYKSDDYLIDSLTFIADADADGRTVTLDFTLYGDDEYVDGTLTIEIERAGSSSATRADITYEVDPGRTVSFDRRDFDDFFDDEFDGDDSFQYVVFEADSSLKSSNGILYYDYEGRHEEEFSRSDLEDYEFYYRDGDYDIDDLTFVADDDADGAIVTLDFIAYGEYEDVSGVLKILIGDVDSNTSSDKGDLQYTVLPGEEVAFDRYDFYDFFREEYSGTPRYVTFSPDSSLKASNGVMYYDYGGRDEEEFSRTGFSNAVFYYSDSEYGDYPLDELTFVADDDFEGTVAMDFRISFDEDKYVDGTLTITSETTAAGSIGFGSVRYAVTTGTAVQINAYDFARLYRSQHGDTSTFQYVKFLTPPSKGSLYYNYYGSGRQQLTSSNISDNAYYLDASSSQRKLTELTYIPSGSNYCATIPFVAYGSGSRTVVGSILISVTRSTVSEVYGVTPKNSSVTFPASNIYNAVYSATGSALASIQLLKLPDASVGTVNISGGYVSYKADTSTRYGYNSGTQLISQLKFVPTSGYTGPVEIPYVAYNSAGDAIASGIFSLGVVNTVRRFTDVTSSTWCYKYVTELSDAGVIDGYSDASFRPNNSITYGAALKLIMLAAGYSEQAPTDSSNVFSGYLARAKADGLVTGSVNLTGTITRLQVSQLAAKAMKLSITNLPSAKPFTDTSDVYVQALNAAGIVEGYFENGTSTFKPNNTLTRGHVATIVWRMRNYQG